MARDVVRNVVKANFADTFGSISKIGAVPSLSVDGVNYEYSGATVNPTTGKWVFDKSIIVPEGSIELGEVVTLSEGANNLLILDEVKSENYSVIKSKFDATGAYQPSYINLGVQNTLNVQTTDTTTITSNPLTYSLTGTVTLPDVRQINAITYRTGAAMTNVRGKVTDNSSGVVIRYLPSKDIYDAGTGGFSFISGDNTLDFISTAADSPGVINLGVSPFLIENGQQLDFEIVADSINVLGDATNVPYQIALIQDGEPISISGGDVDGPASSTDKAITIFDGTTGKLIQEASRILVNQTGTQTVISMSPPIPFGITSILFSNSTGFTRGDLSYDDSVPAFKLQSVSTDLEILSSADLDISAPSVNTITIGKTNTTYQQSPGGVHIFASTEPDTSPVFSFSQSGTFGGSSQFTAGTRSPVGVITAAQGSLYIKTGSSPALYFKSGPTTADWTDLSAGGDVDGPASATDNSIAVFDGTTGKLIKGFSNATLNEVTNDIELVLRVPGATGNASIPILNSSGVTKGEIIYEETADAFIISTFGTTDLNLTSGEAIQISCPATNNLDITNTDATIRLDTSNRILLSSTNADTTEGFVIEQTTLNPGSVGIHVGNRSPEGNVTASSGDIYIRDGGVDSTIYIKQTTSGNTGWADLDNAGVTTPGSSTDNAIVLWNGTGGDSIDEEPNAIITRSGTDLYLRLRNVDDTSIVGHWLVDAANVINGELSYDETNDDLRLIASNGTGISLDSSTTVDIAAVSSGNIRLDVSNRVEMNLTTDSRAQFGSILPDTDYAYSFRQNGTNGGFTAFHIGIRNPEGLVTAAGGYIYIRDAGTNSAMYIKKTETGNTGWAKISDSDDHLTTPTTTTDNAVVLWNGTGGDNIDEDSNLTVERDVNNISLILQGIASGAGVTRTVYKNFAGDLSSIFGYNSASNATFINCNQADSEFILIGNGLVDITTTATNDVRLTNTKAFIVADSSGECRFSSTNNDTEQAFLFEQLGTNGGTSRWHVGSRTPVGNVTGNGGDFYIRDSGVNSTIYVKKVDGGTTGWTDVTASAFDDINWAASVNRRYSDGKRTQNIGTSYSIYDAPIRNLQTTAGKLVPDVASGTIEVLDIDDTTNGDLYEVMFTGSIATLTGYDLYMRIVAFDGTNRVGYLGSVDDNSVQLNDIYCNGSNFPLPVSMIGIIRGPSSFVGGGTPGFRVEARNINASGQLFTNSCYFSVRRIK